jgi:glycosyltransferase involved in cell wall biosynthesis
LNLLVLADFVEEGWPSMDLVGEMLVAAGREIQDCRLSFLRPEMIRAARRLTENRRFRNLDRAVGRYAQYPVATLRERKRFSAYHVVDHSYAHLALCLPVGRIGIYCHDVDAFRASFRPRQGAADWRWSLAWLLRKGMERASVVFYSTDAVRRDLEREKIAPRARLVKAPYGVAPEFLTSRTEPRERDLLLHVGSLIPRKNPAFLLEILAEVRKRRPGVRLLQIGGEWAPAERAAIAELGLEGAIEQRRGLSREELARCYRRAGVVLQPSLAEGFGIPVAEALASGAPVVASDIPTLREVGQHAAIFCPLDSVEPWVDAVERALDDGESDVAARVAWGRTFSWRNHAQVIIDAYRKMTEKPGREPPR